jgi:protein-tyrosine phosphatase
MIDLHSHILPNVDDGPDKWEESMELCRMMAVQGIRTVVATPHYWPGLYEPPVQLIQDRVKGLNERLRKAEINMEVLCGSEIYFCPEMIDLLIKKNILSLNGSKYVLIELPQQLEKGIFLEVFFQLQLKGYVPVVAHPEKNKMIQENPDIMSELVQKGALGQITASSLLDSAATKSRQTAQLLLERNSVQIMATDTHSIDSRPPLLKQGLGKAALVLDSMHKATEMVSFWPKMVIRSLKVQVPQPIRPQEIKVKPGKRIFTFLQSHLFGF